MTSPATNQILIVDDSKDICDMLAMLLKPYGLRCISATDARSARGLLSSSEFSLFILDTSIPGLSGIDLCKEIRSSESSSPIVFYSGYSDHEHRLVALDAGANAYVIKPGIVELFATVTSLLELN